MKDAQGNYTPGGRIPGTTSTTTLTAEQIIALWQDEWVRMFGKEMTDIAIEFNVVPWQRSDTDPTP